MIICGYCQRKAILVTGEEIYPQRPEFYHLMFWKCRQCEAHVGCYRATTIPFGTLADSELRKWRSFVHISFDKLWKKRNGVRPPMTRSQAYQWLSKKMDVSVNQCHIGFFNVTQCKMVIDIMSNEEA